MNVYFKKYKHLRFAFKASGGIALTILGAALFLFSTFYMISAFSKGLIPYGIIASLVAMVSLVLITKGIRLFWQPLTSWEMHEMEQKKKRKKSAQDTANANKTSTEETMESETDQIRQQQVETEDAEAEMEVAPELPLLNLELPEQIDLEEKPEEILPTSEKEMVEVVLEQEPQQVLPAQTSTAVPIKNVQFVKAPDEIPFMIAQRERGEVTQVNEANAHSVRDVTPQRVVGATEQTANKNVQVQTTTQVAKTAVVESTAATKSISTEIRTIPVQATKSLQLVSILLNLVTDVIKVIKNAIQTMTNSTTADATATPSAKAEPTATPKTPTITPGGPH